MKIKFLLYGWILTLLLGSAVTFAADGEPFYSNEWIAGRIQGAIAYNTYLDSTDIQVKMDNGVATLNGVVTSEVEKELAQDIATNVVGVKAVQNNIQINPELVLQARPELVQKIVDATTTAAVKTRLLSSKSMHDMDIKISTKDGVVLLDGTVGTLEQRDAAARIAFYTRDVRDVRNELKIADPNTLVEKATNASVQVIREVSDSWISSKIRTSLLFSSDFPGSNVSVSTSKGTVTLAGTARTAEQRLEIEHAVSEYLGVLAVQNNLEVKNPEKKS